MLLTFDDAVNVINHATYTNLLSGRRNFNQCPAEVTFFVSHEYTNYQLINDLYEKGHEIALHSISHWSQDYYREADKETLLKEFADQRTLTSHFAAIPANSIQGMKANMYKGSKVCNNGVFSSI